MKTYKAGRMGGGAHRHAGPPPHATINYQEINFFIICLAP